MEELKDEISALKLTVAGLTNEIQALKSQVSAMSPPSSQQHQSQIPSPLEKPKFSPTMSTTYDNPQYLSFEDKKEIKFEMISDTLSCLRYDEGKPARFYGFERDGEEEVKRPQKFNGLTGISLGTFVTPVAGRYRLDVYGRMKCEMGGKAEWYICYASKEDDIYGDDSDSDSDDEETRNEKERIFNEKTTRQLLFTFDVEDSQRHEGHVGIDCDKGLMFWVEVVVLEGRFTQRDCVCIFKGRLIC